VTKLSDGGAFFIPESFNIVRVDTGLAPGHFFGTTYVRDSAGQILDAAGKSIRDATGKIVGIPAIGPKKVIGDPNPKGYWSLINDLGVGSKWRLHFQFDGVYGNDVFNFDRRLLETPAFGAGKAYEAELRGDVPKGYFQARRSIFQEYIEDGSFVKLRELSLTYSLPADLAGHFGAHGAQISLIGRNLHTWTHYSGWDPETNVGAQRTLVRGFAFATVPIPRSVALSVTRAVGTPRVVATCSAALRAPGRATMVVCPWVLGASPTLEMTKPLWVKRSAVRAARPAMPAPLRISMLAALAPAPRKRATAGLSSGFGSSR